MKYFSFALCFIFTMALAAFLVLSGHPWYALLSLLCFATFLEGFPE